MKRMRKKTGVAVRVCARSFSWSGCKQLREADRTLHFSFWIHSKGGGGRKIFFETLIPNIIKCGTLL